VVRLLDEGQFVVSVADIAAATGLDPKAVNRALDALHGPPARPARADPSAVGDCAAPARPRATADPARLGPG
jgi:hypothetical protein